MESMQEDCLVTMETLLMEMAVVQHARLKQDTNALEALYTHLTHALRFVVMVLTMDIINAMMGILKKGMAAVRLVG